MSLTLAPRAWGSMPKFEVGVGRHCRPSKTLKADGESARSGTRGQQKQRVSQQTLGGRSLILTAAVGAPE